MKPRIEFAVLCVFVVGALGFSGTVEAQQPLPLVRANFEGNMPDVLKSEVRDQFNKVVKGDSRGLTPLDDTATRAALAKKSPALAGCDTQACIKRVGETLKCSIAAAILVAGEAQIYDFEVVLYDATTGRVAAKKKGSCEICTAQEASVAFGNLLRTALKGVDVKPIKAPEPKMKTSDGKVSVIIRVDPASARIVLGGTTVGVGSTQVELEPGTHNFEFKADGYKDLTVPVEVAKGNTTIEKTVTLTEETPVATGPTGDVSNEGEETQPTEGDQPVEEPVVTARSGGALDGVNTSLLGWTFVGLGAVSIVTGAVLLSLDGETTCSEGPDTACPNVWDTAGSGGTLLGVGSGLGAVGIVFLLWEVLAGPAPEAARGVSGRWDPVAGIGWFGWSQTF